MQNILSKIVFLIGNEDYMNNLPNVHARMAFDDRVLCFLNDVSRKLRNNKKAKLYPDVITFAFWIRKSSTSQLKSRFLRQDGNYRFGKGVVFHIAPSNVPVNFAYSLVAGLINGNANVVRISSKDFEQVAIIVDALESVLNQYDDLKPYIVLVRYDRDKKINDYLSAISDMRIIWGGDTTIKELRASYLSPRSSEITFADRFSLAVIDSDNYMNLSNKTKIAEDFYNDTYLSDQNACTSPCIIVWMGKNIAEAKKEFWETEYKIVKHKYDFNPMQAINKLVSMYLVSSMIEGCKLEKTEDNRIIRIKVSTISAEIMDYKEGSGFFLEYDCNNIMELLELCDNKKCQTIGYIGKKESILPLVQCGIKGVDRIVPIGKTMDFDLIWDGCDLTNQLTRIIAIR